MLFFLDPVSKFSATYAELIAAIGSADDIGAATDSGSASERGSRTGETHSTQSSPSYTFIVNLLRQVLQHQPQIDLRILAANAGLLDDANPGRTRDRSTTSSESTRQSSISERLNSERLNSGRIEIALSLSELNSACQNLLESPSRILLETSGSTGEPQTVWHSIESLSRGIRRSDEHRDSVWGLAYPLDHLAGLQVLFQALLNFNPLIQLYRIDPAVIHQAIDEHQITHLSCTPTFLRMLLASDAVHPSLRRLTNGGERYDRELDARIRAMFPHASRRNIYASTEVGPLLISDDDRFRVPDHLLDAIKIIEGELWLHKRLRVDTNIDAGMNDRSTNQQTDEIGQPSSTSQNELTAPFFPTGDQVEIIDQQPLTIRFLSRKTEGFNVAGFRVDPNRLESIARQHSLVANARFFGIPNSVTEHVVACDLLLKPMSTCNTSGAEDVNVGSDVSVARDEDRFRIGNEDLGRAWDETQFRTWLAERVQRHELPRIIKIVPELAITDSGKVKRRG